MNDKLEEVHVVMAVEVMYNQTAEHFGCYCICDSAQTAREVIEKDTKAGDIRPGAWVALHALQTQEMI